MNRNALTIVLALTVALISIACASGGETNSTLTTNRNPTPPAETFNAASIESELKKIEADWPKAYKDKDVATIRRILADDIVLTYPDGSTGTKSMEVQLTETGAVTFDAWDSAETKVTVLDANTAFLTGVSTIKNGKLKDPSSQQTIDISGQYRFLDVYAKRNGAWQVVASQVTQVRAQPPAPAKAPQK